MTLKEEFIFNLEQGNWKYFQKKYPLIAYSLRCGTDYYYIEDIAKGKLNNKNDNLLKAASEGIEMTLMAIPEIGAIIFTALETLGINLDNYYYIIQSDLAQNSLHEWKTYINTAYSGNYFDIPDLPKLNNLFITQINLLSHARPKCVSGSDACALEHKHYIARTQLLKENQKTIYNIYYTYFINDEVFNEFVKTIEVYESEEEKEETKLNNTTMLLLLGSLLLTK